MLNKIKHSYYVLIFPLVNHEKDSYVLQINSYAGQSLLHKPAKTIIIRIDAVFAKKNLLLTAPSYFVYNKQSGIFQKNYNFGGVAQRSEHSAHTRGVVGSIPTTATKTNIMARWRSG